MSDTSKTNSKSKNLQLIDPKLLPHNSEAEMAAISCLLIRPSVFNLIVDVLDPDDFFYVEHKNIFSAIMELHNNGEKVDVATVYHKLEEKQQTENLPPEYLSEILDYVMHPTNITAHAKIIREHSQRRKLAKFSTDLLTRTLNIQEDVEGLFNESQNQLLDLNKNINEGQIVAVEEYAVDWLEEYLKSKENLGALRGLPTGYQELDRLLGGFRTSDFITLAARPSMGKSTLMMNLVMNMAASSYPGLIFSLEMPKDQLIKKAISYISEINLSNIFNGTTNKEEDQKIIKATEKLHSQNFYIDDRPDLEILQLRSIARKYKRLHNIQYVVVDYLQLLKCADYHSNREREISTISNNLKAMAKELQIPVIALSQLNRKLEERKDKRPLLADLRESGSIEQDSDVVLFIYRDEVYNQREDNPNKDKAELIIAKQRNGPIGVINMNFNKEIGKFHSDIQDLI
ncbi:MAG: replicative DNA helicase [Bacteroidota bacterium]